MRSRNRWSSLWMQNGSPGGRGRHGFWKVAVQVLAMRLARREVGVTGYSTEAGKSLVELMVVLAIIGIMVGIAIPSYQGMTTRVQARSGVAEIASMLRMARQLAMARRERLVVRFDLLEKTVTLRQADTEGLLEVLRYGDKGIA